MIIVQVLPAAASGGVQTTAPSAVVEQVRESRPSSPPGLPIPPARACEEQAALVMTRGWECNPPSAEWSRLVIFNSYRSLQGRGRLLMEPLFRPTFTAAEGKKKGVVQFTSGIVKTSSQTGNYLMVNFSC